MISSSQQYVLEKPELNNSSGFFMVKVT